MSPPDAYTARLLLACNILSDDCEQFVASCFSGEVQQESHYMFSTILEHGGHTHSLSQSADVKAIVHWPTHTNGLGA